MHYLLRALCWRLVTRRWRMLMTILGLILFSVLLVQIIMWWEKYTLNEEKSVDYQNFNKLLDDNPVFSFNRSGPFAQTLQFCNFPPRIQTDNLELWKDKDSALRLVELHIFTRDGIRTPTHLTELNGIPSLNTHFNCSMDSLQELEQLPAPKTLHQVYDAEFSKSTACQSGELLPMGALQLYLLGKSLMQLYAPALFPGVPVPVVSNWLHLKSTEYSRAKMSAKAFHLGVLSALSELPGRKVASGSQQLQNTSPVASVTPSPLFQEAAVNVEAYQSLVFCDRRYQQYRECACPRLRSYHTEVLQRKVELQREHASTQLQLLRALWREMHQSRSGSTSSSSSSQNPPEEWEHFSVPDLVNLLWPMVCSSSRTVRMAQHQVCLQASLHNLPEAACVPVRLLESVLSLHNAMEKGLTQHDSFRRYSRLAMYPLLSQILRDLRKRQSERGPTVHVYSGHDHTLRILLTALEAYQHQWPAFGAHVVLEVFSVGGGKSLVFRLVVGPNDVTGQLNFCKNAGDVWMPSAGDKGATRSGPVFCRLEALERFLQNNYWLLFDTNKFDKECS